MKKVFQTAIGAIVLATLALAGCSSTQTKTASTSPSSTSSTTSSSQSTSSSTTSAQVVKLVIKTDKIGSDGKQHVAFEPSDFTVTKGQPVKLEIQNYDTTMHTLTANDLNLNVAINAAASAGQPTTASATFTPNKTGSFQWMCMNPCDTNNGEWAMSQKGFMQGTITVK
jgi:plastocyanin